MRCRLQSISIAITTLGRRSGNGSAANARSPNTRSAFLIFSACRRLGRRSCVPRRSVLPAAPSGWCASARAPRCTGRQEPKNWNVRYSKRNGDAVERRVAIDEVDALPGDHDAGAGPHQAVQRGAAEDALLLAPVFDHQEFRAHGAGIRRRLFDGDVGDDAARAGARLLRIHARACKPAHAGFEETPVVVDQRDGFEAVGLTGLARYPVPGLGREHSEPFAEIAVIERPRLAQQSERAAPAGGPLPRRWPGDAAGGFDLPPRT